jgi:transposase
MDVAVRPTGESLNLQAHRCGDRRSHRPARSLITEDGGDRGYRRLRGGGRGGPGWRRQWWSIQRRCAFAQALGKRAKTDLIDAAVIARFAEATKPKLRQMPDEVTRLLADLVARRRQIVEMIAAETRRTRRMSDTRLTKSVARLRKALERELSELDVLIDDQIRGSAVWVAMRFLAGISPA